MDAKLRSDADKLDAMWTVGIAQTFISTGEHGGDIRDGLDHMHEKLLRLSDVIYTRTGKEMAERRHRFLVAFVQALEDEREMEKRVGLDY